MYAINLFKPSIKWLLFLSRLESGQRSRPQTPNNDVTTLRIKSENGSQVSSLGEFKVFKHFFSLNVWYNYFLGVVAVLT